MKYSQDVNNGVRLQVLNRYCIGYVTRGTKYIYSDNMRYVINKGEIFYLRIGEHYVENIPEPSKSFEEILFYYTPSLLNKVLKDLNLTFQFKIDNNHICNKCSTYNPVVCCSWCNLTSFYNSVNQYIKDNIFNISPTGQALKMTELIYLLLMNDECCIKNKILNDNDVLNAEFEQIIHSNIFNNLSIEQLAVVCNKSLTTFKKEFKHYFQDSPHKWFINQRLLHTRLLLISTNKSISEIGSECKFTNTSHFIKLFKKKYSMTPSNFRTTHKHLHGTNAPASNVEE